MDDTGNVYQELVERNPKISQFFRQSDYDFTSRCSKFTGTKLRNLWTENIRKNAKDFVGSGCLVKDVCKGFGFNKASILIGAGPSLNQNLNLLQQLCYQNAQFPFEQQPFLFICSNHQFKPCVEKGIIPHFVILMDASDVVYEQLCVDIPERARGTTLFTNFRADNKVLRDWKKQGRNILFFTLTSDCDDEELEGLHKNKPELFFHSLPAAGNVLNQSWLIAFAYLLSSVFIAIGNDLSYDYDPSLDKRRDQYYADGDYSSNIGTGRDEAKKVISYMGFEQKMSSIVPGHFILEYKPKATNYQLMLYKIWLESRIALQAEQGKKAFHYYNCSDGILGVLSKEEIAKLKKETFDDSDNWYLLDSLYPKNYHTKPFQIAVDEFLQARSMLWQTHTETVVSAR